MSVAEWMSANDIIAFKVFSATDASDLPEGWKSPTKFALDGVVFFDGTNMTVFSDKAQKIAIKEKNTTNHDLSELQPWLDSLGRMGEVHDPLRPITFVGYGSRKFDSVLLVKKHSVSGNHVDLAELVYDASKDDYGDYGRRYDIHVLAELNEYKQTALSHLSFLLRPFSMIAEWRMGLSRNVLKTLAAEAELIAQLYCQVICHNELKIMDERTERPVHIPFEVSDGSLYVISSSKIEEEE